MSANSNLQLILRELKVPFKVSFKHSSAERNQTQSVVVEARDQQGETGYGESCPREYVTSETIHSVYQFFEKNQESIQTKITNMNTLRYWNESHGQEIDENPAAWCAVELALLDLFAKQRQQSVEALLDIPELMGEFHYSAILGDSNQGQFVKIAQQYAALGFTDYKLKLSGDLDKDRRKLTLLNEANSPTIRVRADANNLWENIPDAESYIKALDYPLFAIEEPLFSKDIKELAELGKRVSIPIILDESCNTLAQLNALQCAPSTTWITNVRVSKMGGIIRSLAMLERAAELNIPIIIGAQVGETSLLTRAALTIASQAKDLFVAQEGAFGTLLLENDIFSPCLMFGKAGVLNVNNVGLKTDYGFGLIFRIKKNR